MVDWCQGFDKETESVKAVWPSLKRLYLPYHGMVNMKAYR